MKKICIIFLLSIIISLTAFGFSAQKEAETGLRQVSVTQEYIRIHIRADSNEAAAQAVKYKVRDEIVDYLTPVVATCENKEESIREISARLPDLSELASAVLRKNGFFYGASADLKTEKFPVRVYEGHTLPAGEYLSLIVYLGSGQGDNWWCVVYPPLCFAAPTGQNVIYKSKIAEIITRFGERSK